MYGNAIMSAKYAPGFYECRYQTELVSLTTIVNAENEEMAFRMGLDQIEKQLGIEITPMFWECQLEAE